MRGVRWAVAKSSRDPKDKADHRESQVWGDVFVPPLHARVACEKDDSPEDCPSHSAPGGELAITGLFGAHALTYTSNAAFFYWST